MNIMQCMCLTSSQTPFTSDALRANACSSSVCAWVVKPWCSSRLAALVWDNWRWEGGAELNTWRKHCRAWLPLPLARQNRAASLWISQRGTVAYIYKHITVSSDNDLRCVWPTAFSVICDQILKPAI